MWTLRALAWAWVIAPTGLCAATSLDDMVRPSGVATQPSTVLTPAPRSTATMQTVWLRRPTGTVSWKAGVGPVWCFLVTSGSGWSVTPRAFTLWPSMIALMRTLDIRSSGSAAQPWTRMPPVTAVTLLPRFPMGSCGPGGFAPAGADTANTANPHKAAEVASATTRCRGVAGGLPLADLPFGRSPAYAFFVRKQTNRL